MAPVAKPRGSRAGLIASLIVVLIVAAGGAGWYYFYGRTLGTARAGQSCHVANFQEHTASGAVNVCLRCVSGAWTATSWTSCATTPSSQPRQVECGGTPIDRTALCAVADNPQQAVAPAVPPAEAQGPTSTTPPSQAPVPPAVAPVKPALAAVPKSVRVHDGPTDDELFGGPLAPGEYGANGAGSSSNFSHEIRAIDQAEKRDASGRITQEAATVHVIACPGGRQLNVLQFWNRAGFRPVSPSDPNHSLGDFDKYQDAVRQGCRRN